MADALTDALFYVVPRISPDGAEEVLAKGRFVRSSPVNDRANKDHAYWETADIDGNGIASYMQSSTRRWPSRSRSPKAVKGVGAMG